MSTNLKSIEIIFCESEMMKLETLWEMIHGYWFERYAIVNQLEIKT